MKTSPGAPAGDGANRLALLKRIAIGLATLTLLTAIIGVDYLPPRIDLRVGAASPRDIEAPRTVEFVDIVRTDALRREAMRAVAPVLRPSETQAAAARATVTRFFAAVTSVREAAARDAAARSGATKDAAVKSAAESRVGHVAAIRRAAGVPLPDAAVAAALDAPRSALDAAAAVAVSALDTAGAQGVREEDVAIARERARALARSSPLPLGLRALAGEIAAAAVRPMMEVDLAKTNELQQSAASEVPTQRRRVQQNEMLLRRGEVVTPAHLQVLAAVGVYPPLVTWVAIGGVALVVALLLLATAAYLWQFQPQVWGNNRHLILWSLVVVGTVLLSQTLGAPRFNNYLGPAATGTMLLAILLRPRLALFTAGPLALLVGLAAGREMGPVLVAFCGMLVGVFATRQIHRRMDFGVAGLAVGFAGAVVAVGVGLVEGATWYPEMTTNAGSALANGFLAAVVTIGTLPFLEQVFGLVTPIKLLELANPAHPLLKRLQLEAPGTYHHSIMVGNLAESAAEAIGADALLVRVGTYYHDIGKLRRPAFFVENQMGIDNPHEKMTSSLSALTVGAHVRDGLELAREYDLPQTIADFIPQHHGTALMSYFYHQALERGDVLDESAFRYEGPKPQTPEAAIVMLADAAEAAARALTKPTPDRLDEVVRRLIREKLEDGQLDECGLTFRDLDRAATAFVRILTGILHPRLEYPDLEGELARRRRDRLARVR